MKQLFKKFLFYSLFIASSNTLFGTVWRVNNNFGVNANFTTLSAAHAGASSGDTIYVESSNASYGNAIITKTLTIIGPGYFLGELPQSQFNLLPASVGDLRFHVGSEGSTIMGITQTPGAWYIRTNNITIKRNFLTSIIVCDSFSTAGNLSGILITQNCIGTVAFNNIGGISMNGYNFNSQNYGVVNAIISNNILIGGIYIATLNSNIGIKNNYINSLGFNTSLYIFNSTLQNNIFLCQNSGGGAGPAEFISCSIQRNIFSGSNYLNSSFPIDTIGGVNKLNTPIANIFTLTGSTDGQYVLKTGSPAIGFGVAGIDCGPYGGSSPYILSGLPGIPTVYELGVAPGGNSTTGLNVTIKAKSRP